MSTNLPEFKEQMAQAQRRLIVIRPHRVLQVLTLEVLRRLVLRTPVRTGRARGSWQVAGGAPAASSPVGADPSGVATIAKGTAAVQTLQPGQDAYVTSNLVYMPALERGHSKQAPHGMVALTVEEMRVVSAQIAAQTSTQP